MRLVDTMKDPTHVNGPKQFFEEAKPPTPDILVASIVKISTFNKDVLDSEWARTTRACTEVDLHLITDKNVCIAYDKP